MDLQLSGLSAGTKYYVQVRAVAKGDKSQVSEWSNPYPFTTTSDTVAPSPVGGLTLTSEGNAFVAKWTAPSTNANGSICKDLAGYKIQFKDTDGVSANPAEIITVDNKYTLSLEENRALFGGTAKPRITIEVVAVDQIGNRSTKSTAMATNPPPANVTGLTVENGLESLVCKWNANTDHDLTGYEIHASTTGAGFTPDGTTLRYKGPASTATISSFNLAQHWVKVYATDVFDQKSVTPATGTGTPRQTGSSDGSPPGVPTAVTLAPTPVSGQLKVSWTPPSDTDVDRFVVRYGLDTVDVMYENAPSDTTSVVINGVKPGKEYYVAVKAVDFAGNSSTWANATVFPYTTQQNTSVIPKPWTPVVAPIPSALYLQQEGRDHTGADTTNADIVKVELYLADPIDPSISDSQLFGWVDYAGGGFITWKTFPLMGTEVDNYHWRTRFVTADGKAGPVSDSTSGNPALIVGENIANATIGDAKIGDLSASKLIANTAFINSLKIQNSLIIDHDDGRIESDNFSAVGETGWRINRNGITIYDGTVKASSVEIQSSPNIAPAQFSNFEFAKVFYCNETTNAPSAEMVASAGTLKVDTSGTAKFGSQSLRVWDTTSVANNKLTFAKSGAYNIEVAGGQTYITSIWVKNQLAASKTVHLYMEAQNGEYFFNTVTLPASADWTRFQVQGLWTTAVTAMRVAVLSPTATPIDFLFDGLQVERKTGSGTTASPWSPNGMTSINGGAITTGSIKSSAGAVGIAGQPAWSLNAEGNAQFGDAIIRGNLTVGAGADTTNSVVRSANFATGASGWVIKGDGNVEFNSGVFRGTLGAGIVTASSLQSNLVLSDKIIAGTAGGIRMEMTGGTGATAGLIAYSAASTKSLQINTNGTFTAFNTSGQRTLDIDTSGNFRTYNASTQATIFTLANTGTISIANSGGNTFVADAAGNLTIRGKIMTAASGARIEIEPSVGITFYSATNSTNPVNYTRWAHSSFSNSTWDDGLEKSGFKVTSPRIRALKFLDNSNTYYYAELTMPNNFTELFSFRVKENGTNYEMSRMMIRAKDVEIIAGPNVKAEGYDPAYGRSGWWNNWAPMLYMPWGGHAGAGTPGKPIILLSHLLNNTGNTNLHRSGFQGSVDPNVAAVIYSNNGLTLRNFTNTIYTTFTAGDINGGIIKYNQLVQNTSGVQFKENFTKLPDKGLDVLRNAPVSQWNYKDKPEETRIGPIATDLPDWLTVPSTELFVEEADAKEYTKTSVHATRQANSSYELTAIIGVMWEAIRELDEELDAYRQQLGYTLPTRRFTHEPETPKEVWVENTGTGEVVERPERPPVVIEKED